MCAAVTQAFYLSMSFTLLIVHIPSLLYSLNKNTSIVIMHIKAMNRSLKWQWINLQYLMYADSYKVTVADSI